MPETLSIPVAGSTAEPSPARRLPEWLREPLLHFVLLGGLLFGVDHYLVARQGDPHTIVVDASVDAEARKVFEASRGRKPNAEELYALRRVWLDNEVLYREGLALQLDKGDASIRERVIFKSLSTVDAGLTLPPHDDRLLRSWFEKNRAKYDQPARFDFQEAVLAGESGESAVRDFVATLNAGRPGDVAAGLRVFKDRPLPTIEQSYGEEFARDLQTATPGVWHALRTRDGWRAIRLESAAPPRPASYEEYRGVVLQDWTDAVMAEQRSAAVRAMAKKYTVTYEAAK